MSKGWKKFVGDVDTFFVNEEFEDDINDSYIRFNYTITFEEGKSEVVDYDLKIRAKFPKISKKANLILKKESDDDEDEAGLSLLTKDDQNINKREVGDSLKNDTYSAALRYFVLEKQKWKISTDVGMKIDVPFDPFLKLRLKRSFKFDKNELAFIQKFSYFRIDELSETSTLIWTTPVGKEDKIKFEVDLGWTEASSEFTGDHVLSYLQKLSKRRAISYSIGTSYRIKDSAYYDRYQAAINYRQLLFKDWIFGQGAIGTIFRKEENFNSSEYISFSLDMIF